MGIYTENTQDWSKSPLWKRYNTYKFNDITQVATQAIVEFKMSYMNLNNNVSTTKKLILEDSD
jgi:hypothetical protein